MKLTVKDIQGNDRGELEVALPLIEGGRATQAVHDVVVAYQAAQRSGTACTKTMGDVNGTGKKPWRQKGTGRARAGSFASPLWRGGGVVFGPKPRDYDKKISKRTKKLALQKALTERLNAGDVMVVDDFSLPAPKTKEFIKILGALKIEGSVLVVGTGADEKLSRAARNVSRADLMASQAVTTYDILRPSKLVFTRAAFEQLQKRIAADVRTGEAAAQAENEPRTNS